MKIFLYLNTYDLKLTPSVCRFWNRVNKLPFLWNILFKSHFPWYQPLKTEKLFYYFFSTCFPFVEECLSKRFHHQSAIQFFYQHKQLTYCDWFCMPILYFDQRLFYICEGLGIVVKHLETTTHLASPKNFSHIQCEGTYLFALSTDGLVTMWDYKKGLLVHEFSTLYSENHLTIQRGRASKEKRELTEGSLPIIKNPLGFRVKNGMIYVKHELYPVELNYYFILETIGYSENTRSAEQVNAIHDLDFPENRIELYQKTLFFTAKQLELTCPTPFNRPCHFLFVNRILFTLHEGATPVELRETTYRIYDILVWDIKKKKLLHVIERAISALQIKEGLLEEMYRCYCDPTPTFISPSGCCIIS